ncbi:MAG: zinc-binding dehydrogenase [Armatimonadota bacterium]|nr:zinc-binding dehydrogenase [Armatimonadota bacterium]
MKIVMQMGNSKIEVEARPRPQPKPGQVLVKTVVSALCGSEMSGYHKAGYPSGNMGHEAAGIVAERGAGLEMPRVGQRVGVSAIAGCGSCSYCEKGQFTWCDRYEFYDNMHAEYFVIPALACHSLPDEVPWDVGVLITGDGLGVPYHTATKISGAGVEDVAIFGLGPVGLGNVMFQTYMGRRVIGIDRSPERLELARQLGALHTIAVDDDTNVPASVRAMTGGRGADVCIEAAGVPTTAKQCFSSVRTGGCVVFNGEQPAVELSPSEDFIRRDITAVGSWFYHFSEYPAMLELFRQGLPVSSLITHRFPLERAAEAYRMMEGKSGKVLIEYGPEG